MMLLGELLDGLFCEYSHIFNFYVAKIQKSFDITKYFSIILNKKKKKDSKIEHYGSLYNNIFLFYLYLSFVNFPLKC